ncbi:MAG: amidohydrolase family protein [Saprospiraceae bacterium]|nr:amidohydrolase family protein [Saprospiraceae bacterium]
MKIISILIAAGLLVQTATLMAQAGPVPAKVQAKGVILTGATAHIGNGQVIENSVIAFDKGKITFVGTSGQTPSGDLSTYTRVDAGGKHVYPGLIAPNTQLGLVEIEAVRATRDASEIGDLNPSIRSLVAYNTDSHVIPTVRSQGILLAQIVPDGGRISGQSSVVQLDAWNWEDAAYQTDGGVHMTWPEQFRFNRFTDELVKNDGYATAIQEMEAFFKEAQAYLQKQTVETRNLKFEAVRGLFDGSKRLFVNANTAKSIQQSVLFAKQYQFKLVIVGGRDAWLVSDLLKTNDVAVILGSTQSLPATEDADVDQPFKLPVLLQQAGVEYCIGHEGFWQQRNLAFQAGQAVGFGLGKEEAIAALTLNTAKILGIEARTGSLEVGKDANLFVSEGDILDMRTSIVTHAYIQGRSVDLDNKQKALYRRFKQRYEK